ncbi:MAG: spore germination protein [Acutalibacteraceae bacterium]
MYKFVKELKDIYTHKPRGGFKESETPLDVSMKKNLEYIKSRFENSADLTIHEMKLSGIDTAVITIEGMVNKDILALGVIKPLFEYKFSGTPDECFNAVKSKILYTAELVDIETYEMAEKFAMSGFAVLAVNGCKKMLAIGIQGFSFRSVSEPESDVVQRGSKEGFVEALRINMSLIRRRIKNPKLKFETMTVGKVSKTDICLCYLTDTVSKKILNKLKQRISSTDLDTVFASGYLVPFLEERGDFSFFSGVGVSERPDTVCGKITEGRIAVLIDGAPSALIVPYLFVEYFQTLDDYSNRAYFATFTRWLKYFSFFISFLLPGIYTALGTFHPEMFPTLLLNKIAGAIGDTPLSLMAETILIHFVYEIMREAGLRMPQPLGYAVSIVGGLVVGETAVNSGLIGAPTLMVVAITAICSYVIPSLYAPSAVLRLIFTLAGGILGIWGVAFLFCMVLVNICGKNSFGVPYTSPVTPFSASAMRDVAVRAGWKILSKKREKIQDMPGVNLKSEDNEDER